MKYRSWRLLTRRVLSSNRNAARLDALCNLCLITCLYFSRWWVNLHSPYNLGNENITLKLNMLYILVYKSRTENHILFGHSVAEILNVKVWEINNFLFYFLSFFLNPVANMAANYIRIKKKTKVYLKMK